MLKSNIYAFLVIGMLAFTPFFIYRHARRPSIFTFIRGVFLAFIALFFVITITRPVIPMMSDKHLGVLGGLCAFLSILSINDWRLSIKTMFGYSLYCFLLGCFLNNIFADELKFSRSYMGPRTYWHTGITGIYPVVDEKFRFLEFEENEE